VPTASPLQDPGAPGNGVALIWMVLIRTVNRVGGCQASGEKRRIAPYRQRAEPRELGA